MCIKYQLMRFYTFFWVVRLMVYIYVLDVDKWVYMVQICLIIADIIGILGAFLCVLASFILVAFSIKFTVNELDKPTLLKRFLRFLKDTVVGQGQKYGYELLGLGFILILIDRIISFLCLHCLQIFELI